MRKINIAFIVCVALLLQSFEVHSTVTQQVVSLTKFQCTTGQEANNTTVIVNSLAPDTILQFPEGNFSASILQIQGINNLTLRGKKNSATGEVLTNLKIMYPSGLEFSTGSPYSVIDMNIEGPEGLDIIKLSNASTLSFENVELKAGTSTLYTECLTPDFSWLIPIINHVLF